MTDKNNSNEYQAYKQTILDKAEHYMRNSLPEKIVELNALLEQSMFDHMTVVIVNPNFYIPPPQRVGQATNNPHDDWSTLGFGETLPLNEQVGGMIEVLMPNANQLAEDSQLLQMWLAFIPKGDHISGATIAAQEGMMARILTAKMLGSGFAHSIFQYYLRRARVVTEILRHPEIEDYRHALVNMDEKQHFHLCAIARAICDSYIALYDFLAKNYQALKNVDAANSG